MKKIMPWLDGMRDVGATDFLARRERIASLLQQATQPTPRAAHYLTEAYVETSKLEDDAKARWSVREIERAQRCNG